MDRDKMSGLSNELLNQITNIGAKNAALVLTKMTGIEIEVNFPDMHKVKIENLFQADDFKDKLVSFVFCRIKGDVDGIASLVLPGRSIMTVLKAFFGRNPQSLDELEEIDFSGIKEIGNIIIGSFLNALSNEYGITVMPSIPDVAVDYVDSIFEDFSLMLIDQNIDELVSLRTQLIANGQAKINFGSLLILFDPGQDMPNLT